MDKAFVLLSGGIDSTTCLFSALAALDQRASLVTAISVFYGQRHSREIEHAAGICSELGVEHHIIDLSSIIPKTMLTDPEQEIPNKSYDEIVGVSPTYVPFRNGLMLAALASFIGGRIDGSGTEVGLYFGAHAEDAQNWAYPDCTPEFIGAMANAIYIGSYRQVRLITPLEWLVKPQIIMMGDELGVPWKMTWSCYAGGEKHCGTCPTCRSRRQGFFAAGVFDPTEYASG